MRRFRVFISSPGDTLVERRRAEGVVSRLNGEFAGIARLEAVRWETEHYSAHRTYQDQIPPAMDCDVVIGILRWRLGTELPPGFETQPSGEPYPSGTAYEILTAMEKRRSGAELPDVFVFRFTGGAPSIVLGESEEAAKRRDWGMLQSFLASWFVTEQGHFIAALNNYASEDDFERQAETLLRKWLAGKVQGRQGVPWPAAKGSPFRGLDAFGARHAAVFFGRSADIRRATDLWRGASAGSKPFLLVVGASGAGKSSLVRAGLIPRLTTPGVVPEVDLWRVAVMRPGDSPDGPFMALAAALLRGEADLPSVEEGRGPALPEIAEGDSKTPADLGAVLSHADASAARVIVNALTRIAERRRDSERHERATRCDLLLLVDQAEELFASSVASDARSRFADLLRILVASGRVWLAVTLRADTYAAWLAVPALKALKDEGVGYDLATPGAGEMAEIVRAPAAAAGLSFDLDAATGERLDEVLLGEADQPDMLPLVQLAMSRLWEARETRGEEILLPFSAYRRIGGVRGIVEEAGERAVMGLDASRLAPLIRKLGGLSSRQNAEVPTITSRSVRLDEAAPDPMSRMLVDALVKARLLTLSDDSGVMVRLSHQRVLVDWKRASAIVSDSSDFYRIHDDIERQRVRWQERRRGDLLLTRGLPLEEAKGIVGRYGSELSQATLAYVSLSQRRANRAQVLAWSAAAVFLIVAIGAGAEGKVAADSRAVAEERRHEAETQRTEAVKQKLMAQNAAQESQNQRNIAEVATAEAQAQRDAAEQARRISDERGMKARKNQAAALAALAVAALPNNTTRAVKLALASWPRDKSDGLPKLEIDVGIISAAFPNMRESRILNGHTDEIHSLVFSQDGARLLTTSADNTAKLWDSKTGQLLETLAGGDDAIWNAQFSKGGDRILTEANNSSRLWSADGKLIANIEGLTHQYTSNFSPDGSRIVTGSQNHLSHLYDAENGRLIASLAGDVQFGAFDKIASFSPDGQFILTTNKDNTASLWSAATGKMISILQGHEAEIISASFSPNGKYLVTGSDDKTARIWDVSSGNQLALLRGHDKEVWGVNFGVDGSRVVTSSEDGTSRIWTLDGSIIAVLPSIGQWISPVPSSVARYVTQTSANSATLWNTKTGKIVAEIDGRLGSNPLSPDGSRFYTRKGDKYLLWNTDDGMLIGQIGNADGDEYTLHVVFSKDGSRAITITNDGYKHVWNTRTAEDMLDIEGRGQDEKLAPLQSLSDELIATYKGNNVILWSHLPKRPYVSLRGHTGSVADLNFSPDGRHIVTASDDHTARVWDVATGNLIGVLTGHTEPLIQAIYSDDGENIITRTSKENRVWDAGTLSLIDVNHLEDAEFRSDPRSTKSRDGSLVASTMADQRTLQIAYVGGKVLYSLEGTPETINEVSFSQDRNLVAASRSDGSVDIWRIYPRREDIITSACKALPDYDLKGIAQNFYIEDLDPICQQDAPEPDQNVSSSQ